MSKKIAVIVIYGMGSPNLHFADGMKAEISKRISKLSKNPDEIAWKPIYWADILYAKPTSYLESARRNHDIGWIGLRRFVLNALGDATAYQRVESDHNTSYKKIHERVDEAHISTNRFARICVIRGFPFRITTARRLGEDASPWSLCSNQCGSRSGSVRSCYNIPCSPHPTGTAEHILGP